MSGRKAIAVLFLFGMTLIVIGILGNIFNAVIIEDLLPDYWVPGTAMDLVLIMWHVIFTFILGLGILFLIMGGMEARSNTEAF